MPLTAQTGTLWFFGADDPELIVKMVDGTAVNGHHWLFYASLSDVDFDLTATDTTTGEQRVYHNPAGTLASLADAQAFPLNRAGGQAPRRDAGQRPFLGVLRLAHRRRVRSHRDRQLLPHASRPHLPQSPFHLASAADTEAF